MRIDQSAIAAIAFLSGIFISILLVIYFGKFLIKSHKNPQDNAQRNFEEVILFKTPASSFYERQETGSSGSYTNRYVDNNILRLIGDVLYEENSSMNYMANGLTQYTVTARKADYTEEVLWTIKETGTEASITNHEKFYRFMTCEIGCTGSYYSLSSGKKVYSSAGNIVEYYTKENDTLYATNYKIATGTIRQVIQLGDKNEVHDQVYFDESALGLDGLYLTSIGLRESATGNFTSYGYEKSNKTMYAVVQYDNGIEIKIPIDVKNKQFLIDAAIVPDGILLKQI